MKTKLHRRTCESFRFRLCLINNCTHCFLTCLGRDAAHVETGAAQRGVLLHTDSLQAQLGSLITKDGSFISLKEDKSIR